MKDKLRELVDRWLGADEGKFHEYDDGVSDTLRECGEELLAILDAEGDGGAVGDAVSLESALAAIDHVGQHNGPGRSIQARAMLKPVAHPARSGVVSDEEIASLSHAELIRRIIGERHDR